MIEVVRLVHAALTDGTNGVNVKLAALALDGTDARPASVGDFRNVADHDLGAREGDATFPALYTDIRQQASAQGYATSGVRDGSVTVTVCYICESGVTAANFRATDYTLRAVAKALHAQFWAGTGSDAARKRNNIAIKNSPTMSISKVEQSLGTGTMTGAVDITFQVRDLAP